MNKNTLKSPSPSLAWRNHNVAARQGSHSFHVLFLIRGYQEIEANRENNFLRFRRVHAWLLSPDSLPFNTFQCAFARQCAFALFSASTSGPKKPERKQSSHPVVLVVSLNTSSR